MRRSVKYDFEFGSTNKVYKKARDYSWNIEKAERKSPWNQPHKNWKKMRGNQYRTAGDPKPAFKMGDFVDYYPYKKVAPWISFPAIVMSVEDRHYLVKTYPNYFVPSWDGNRIAASSPFFEYGLKTLRAIPMRFGSWQNETWNVIEGSLVPMDEAKSAIMVLGGGGF